MNEQFLRNELTTFLNEQEVLKNIPTKVLCLLAGILDYSFSDGMINELPQFLPTPQEITKYK